MELLRRLVCFALAVCVLVGVCQGVAEELIATSTVTPMPREVRFEYFDDYIISIAAPSQGRQEEVQVPAEPPTPAAPTSTPAPGQSRDMVEDRDITGYFREIPREDWSCCMLGKLAGDKGFQCQVGFYSARISRRNNNRAHNDKMLFHGPDNIPNWGRSIMTTFSRCIYGHGHEFHRCCQAAAIEKRERVRWQQYRIAAAASSKK